MADLPQRRGFLIALQHHAEGLTFEQIGVLHKISMQRAYQIYRQALTTLGLFHQKPGKITAEEIGLAIQRRAESFAVRESGEYVGTTSWFQDVLAFERRRDWDNYRYEGL